MWRETMSVLIIPQKEWKPESVILEDSALKVVKSDYNTLVIAGPGAGKTELLAQRACYLLQTNTCTHPKRILAVSFKKDAASNLLDRVKTRCGKELTARFESMTFDSFAKETLDRFYQALPLQYRPVRDYRVDAKDSFIKEAFRIAGYDIPQIDSRNSKPDIPRKVLDIMLHGDKIHDFQPALNFNLISRLSNYLLQTNPHIVVALQATYSHVFLDEFQDTTETQYDLVKTCFLGSTSVVTAVGDKKQRIMIWAGAMPEAFEKYQNDFKAQEETMLMNHRSAPKLLMLQKSLYKVVNEKEIDIEPDSRWQPDEGEVNAAIFTNEEDEANYILDNIKSLLGAGIKTSEVCILIKRSLAEYATYLLGPIEGTEINVRDETVYQDLLKEDFTKLILSTIYCSLSTTTPEVYTYLYESDLHFKSVDIEDIERVNSELYKIGIFLSNIKDMFDKANLDSGPEVLTRIIEAMLNYFDEKAIKDYFLQYQNEEFLNEIKSQLCELLWSEFVVRGTWIDACIGFEGNFSIPVMTVHKSKGLEFDAILFLGLEENAFFASHGMTQEDASAFFVAVSRARRMIYITATENRNRINRGAGVQSTKGLKPIYSALKASGVVEYIDNRRCN